MRKFVPLLLMSTILLAGCKKPDIIPPLDPVTTDTSIETSVETSCDDDPEENSEEWNTLDYNYEKVKKPVVYMYSKYDYANIDIGFYITDVLDLDFAERNMITYPETGCCWNTTAHKDGIITVKKNWDNDIGKYKTLIDTRYLFWEADMIVDVNEWQYCVKRENVIAFLSNILAKHGLNDIEKADFITYWAPILMKNEWNLISFDTTYEDSVTYEMMIYERTDKGEYIERNVPDTFIRVFMAYQPVNECIDIKYREKIITPRHNGTTIVEWGGCEIPKG